MKLPDFCANLAKTLPKSISLRAKAAKDVLAKGKGHSLISKGRRREQRTEALADRGYYPDQTSQLAEGGFDISNTTIQAGDMSCRANT